MATATQTNSEDGWTEESEGANANSPEQWDEVESESQIVMEREGDAFTGRLLGIDPPMQSGIIQAHFDNVVDSPPGDYFMNLTKDLVNKLKKVPEKATVRIKWESSLNTGQITPMRVYKVLWKR